MPVSTIEKPKNPVTCHMNATSLPPWTPAETKQVVNAFRIVREHGFRVNGQSLPREAFFAWLETFYAIVIEVIITSVKKPGMVYLIRRPKNDPFYGGQWHMPGVVLWPGEKKNEAVRRVLVKELSIDINKFVFDSRVVDDFDNVNSPRGHEPALLIHAEIPKAKVRGGRWFQIDRLLSPLSNQPVIAHHRVMLERFQHLEFKRMTGT